MRSLVVGVAGLALATSGALLAVPASAVVRENDRDYVFVKQGERRYRLTEVQLEPAAGELTATPSAGGGTSPP